MTLLGISANSSGSQANTFLFTRRNLTMASSCSGSRLVPMVKVALEDPSSSTGIVIPWLNRDDRLLISIRNSFFSGSPFGQNSKVKRAQLGVVSGWVTDREVPPGCARVRTKCAEKTSIDLWGQSRSLQEQRPPAGVSGALQVGIRANP